MTAHPNPENIPHDDTVLARINDPAPQMEESDEPTAKGDPHERLDDPTVLAHINGPEAVEDTKDSK